MTLEQKNKIRDSHVGIKMSEDAKKKMSLAKIGSKGYWTGKKRSKESVEKTSKALLERNKNRTFYTKKCLFCSKEFSFSQKSKLDSKKYCNNICKVSHRRGENSHKWKGGVTPINKAIRMSMEYKLWRIAVFERDNYTCIWCGFKGTIHADHIKPFSQYPELRFAIDNGRTLCVPCHKTTDTWGSKSNK